MLGRVGGWSIISKRNLYLAGDSIYLIVDVIFYSGKRNTLPVRKYRPDIIVDGMEDSYWGITFTDIDLSDFDVACIAEIKFTFQPKHYAEVSIGQTFKIMEGANQVGEGKILFIETE